MSNKFKETDIKNRLCFFFDEIINIKNLDPNPNKVKINKKSHKGILIYNIGYVTIKNLSYVKINSVNPLHFIFNKINWYIGKNNENKYLTLVPTDKNKDTLKKYE